MFHSNDYYGHRKILGWYTGRASPPPVFGHLQHGWNHSTGFGTRYWSAENPKRLNRFLPKLVWADRNVLAAREFGLPRVFAVGAPFVYLDTMLNHGPDVLTTPHGVGEGTIVYPLHSVPGKETFRGETRFIEEIREREEGPVTVSLYWREAADPEIRTPYERAGFRVVSNGRRDDPSFLFRQRETLLAHRRVVSNRVSTALWYGAFLGREVEVYGPVFGSRSLEFAEWFDNFQRREWPQLMSQAVSGLDADALGRQELGANNIRPPEELSRLFGWKGWRRTAGPLVEAVAEARRAVLSRKARDD